MSKTQLFDSYTGEHLIFDASPKRTVDGYMVATAKVARTGIQIYKGDELGHPDKKAIRVYRPDAEVFSEDSMMSYAHKPITLDHPPEMVSDGNYTKYSRGTIDGHVLRDGQYISVPMMLCDRKAIDAVMRGVKELSVGYTMDLDMTPGKTEGGEVYDAVMSNIRVNHLAVVPAARGGPELRIGDDDDNKRKEKTMTTKRILVDGLPVDVADDQGAAIIEKQLTKDAAAITDLKAKLDKSVADAATAKAASDAAAVEAKKAIDTKDGEIVILKKSVEDSKWTPAKISAKVKERTIITTKSKPFLGDKFDYDNPELIDIQRAALTKHLGDADVVKAMSDDKVDGAFMLMTKDVKSTDGAATLANALTNHNQNRALDSGDAVAARQKAFDESSEALADAWKTKAA